MKFGTAIKTTRGVIGFHADRLLLLILAGGFLLLELFSNLYLFNAFAKINTILVTFELDSGRVLVGVEDDPYTGSKFDYDVLCYRRKGDGTKFPDVIAATIKNCFTSSSNMSRNPTLTVEVSLLHGFTAVVLAMLYCVKNKIPKRGKNDN